VDSVVKPEDLVVNAKRRGLHGVAITEHGNKKIPGIEELSQKYNFFIIGGIEASTELGDILVFGIDSFPRELIRAADLRKYVLEAGGLMVAAHPFRYDSQKPWLKKPEPITLERAAGREIFRLVDAIEVVNGWATPEDVDFAFKVSEHLSMGGTGGSDAHAPNEVGWCVTVFENGIRTEADFLQELRRGRFRAEDRSPEDKKKPTHGFF